MLNVFSISGSALSAQTTRMNAIASNMANADTVVDEKGEAYRAKKVVFAAALSEAEALRGLEANGFALDGGVPLGLSPSAATVHAPFAQTPAGGVAVHGVYESDAPARMVYDPTSPFANDKGYVAMPNVNVIEEMTDMIAASRSYQNNVEVMNTAKTLLQKTLALGQS